MSAWPTYGKIDGPIVMIGFGSIGRGTLPLLLRHFSFDRGNLTVIDPNAGERDLVEQEGGNFIQASLTPENYREILSPLLDGGKGRPFVVNLSVDVSSLDVMRLSQEKGALYIDTVIEPWLGFYYDTKLSVSERSNYALREEMRAYARNPASNATAVSCCGANPGMVSWFVKQALLNLAGDLGMDAGTPSTREDWADLMRRVGVKGIHIAERDTQRATRPKPLGTFFNTWSVEGFISEGLQPAELGWGTHENWMPDEGRRHDFGCDAAIYLMRPGAATKVRTWTPTAKAQHGMLVTHNEAISISDYYTVSENGKAVYRPTCHYAYHPANDAVLSMHELAGSQWQPQKTLHVLEEHEILDGVDELGVLLFGHGKNAYWYGSRLSIEETRRLAPYQNATGLQVSSAVLAGMVWALENPESGVVETDEMDFARCLEVQTPYLGKVFGEYTDWNPLVDRGLLFPEDIDESDPWQFRNVLVR